MSLLCVILPSTSNAVVIIPQKPHIARIAQVVIVPRKNVRTRYATINLQNGYVSDVVGYDESDCALHDVYDPKEDIASGRHSTETTWHYVTCQKNGTGK